MTEFKRVLAPTDLSPFGEVGLRAAADLAVQLDATLTILHVVPEDELGALANAHSLRHPVDLIYQDLESAIMDQFRRVVSSEVRRALRVEPMVSVGTPAVEIVRAAHLKGADLIALGTHGRTGLARMVMGSVAEQVVRRAPCAVLTIRPAEVFVGVSV